MRSLVCILATAAVVAVTSCSSSPPDRDARFLAAVAEGGVTPAPGHAGNVVAAGYRICAELHAGGQVDDVVRHGIRHGIGGDLYTSTAVPVLVTAAAETLCTSAAGPTDRRV